MPLLTILIGAALVVTGAVAYFVSDSSSLTALIPAAVGLLLVIAGLIAWKTSHILTAVTVSFAIFGLLRWLI